MSVYAIILLLASCSFVVIFADPNDLTSMSKQRFDSWQCENLCNEPGGDQKVKDKCADFHDPALDGSYTVEKIKQESGCKQAYVYLKSSTEEDYVSKHVGICYLSSKDKNDKCLTSGENPGDMVLWKREKRFVAKLWRSVTGGVNVCLPHKIIPGAFGASTST